MTHGGSWKTKRIGAGFLQTPTWKTGEIENLEHLENLDGRVLGLALCHDDEKMNKSMINVGLLSLAPGHCRNKISIGKYVRKASFLISQIKANAFVSARIAMIPGTPCSSRLIQKKIHLFRCCRHTYTHYFSESACAGGCCKRSIVQAAELSYRE